MKVLVTGGTGFVGRHLLPRLEREGFDVAILAREQPRTSSGAAFVHGDVADVASLRSAMDGVDAVVHLVAIITERRSQTFDRVNVSGTENVIQAMKLAGVRRLVHQSALGAGPDQRFPYLRSKWLGEETVRASGLDHTVLRPSVLHGESAGFFRPIVWTLRWAPLYPMVAGGATRFSPLWIEDLASCVVSCLRGEGVGATLDLGGPEVLTFSDIVRLVMETLGKRRRVVDVPVWAARPFAAVQGLRRDPLVTNQQLDMVVLDNACDPRSVTDAFGFVAAAMRETDLRWLAKL
jgi:NADH dehydrogenase